MHFKSRVLILDEPTNHLSVKETAKVIGFVRGLPAQDVTGILISHNLHHVFQSCDRVVAMARGEIVFDKQVGETSVEEVFGRPVASTRHGIKFLPIFKLTGIHSHRPCLRQFQHLGLDAGKGARMAPEDPLAWGHGARARRGASM